MERLKRAVIKEELVALTGDFIKAVILSQFIYWSERVDDFDKFILEEQQRAKETGEELTVTLSQGWIYKKAEELAEETMLNLSKSNMMNHIKALVEAGWIEQRRNPRNKMDKTYQYRVNVGRIQQALIHSGYSLEGYRVPLDIIIGAAAGLRSSDLKLRSSETELRSHETEPRGFDSKLGSSDSVPRSSDTEQQYQRLLTENTTEITYTTTAHDEIAVTQDRVVVDFGMVVDAIQEHLAAPIGGLLSDLPRWLQQYGPEYLVEKAKFMGATPDKWANIVGAYKTAVEQDWKNTQASRSDVPEKDNRYSAFYQLYPDS